MKKQFWIFAASSALLFMGQNCVNGLGVQGANSSSSSILSSPASSTSVMNAVPTSPIFFPQLYANYCNYAMTSSTTPTPDNLKSPTSPEIWYYQNTYLQAGADLTDVEAQMRTAKSAGFTGVVLWDSYVEGGLISLGQNTSSMQAIFQYGQSIGLKVIPQLAPLGYAWAFGNSDPNLFEGFKVQGAPYSVVAGTTGNNGQLQLQLIQGATPMVNADFSAGLTGWSGRPCKFRHRRRNFRRLQYLPRGSTLRTLSATSSGDTRLIQTLTVTPHRMYHISFWYKSSGMGNNLPQVMVVNNSSLLEDRLETSVINFSTTSDTDWTKVDYVFNSATSTQVLFQIGFWNWTTSLNGQFWVDDIIFEETGLINLVRRPLAPLKIYDSNNVYTEGPLADYNPVVDPSLGYSNIISPGAPLVRGYVDFYHTPPVITLPPTSRLKVGQVVSLDYSAAETSDPIEKTSANLAEPSVYDFIAQTAKLQSQSMPGTGSFMEHSEMRQFQTTRFCSQTLGGAQLLGWSLQNTINAIQLGAGSSAAPLYVWSDMFDPYHNAVANYSQTDASLVGSWQYLPANVTIMNWNLGHLNSSLNFFAGKDATYPSVSHPQMIAGYDDSGSGATSAQTELAAARGIPGVQGFLYVSWSADDSQMQAYAQTIQANWANYLSSLPASQVSP